MYYDREAGAIFDISPYVMQGYRGRRCWMSRERVGPEVTVRL